MLPGQPFIEGGCWPTLLFTTVMHELTSTQLTATATSFHVNRCSAYPVITSSLEATRAQFSISEDCALLGYYAASSSNSLLTLNLTG